MVHIRQHVVPDRPDARLIATERDHREPGLRSTMPWLRIPPGAMIALAVLSINFIGDGLRDALDPHLAQ